MNIADNTLVAPREGRIQYRLANAGEVLPAGGKVFTMLDVNYVYMDIYLSTANASRVKAGSDARIVFDAYPSRPIPAHVSMIATQNHRLNPKFVETKEERDKLMFRVRVPDRSRAAKGNVWNPCAAASLVSLTPASIPKRLGQSGLRRTWCNKLKTATPGLTLRPDPTADPSLRGFRI